MSQPATNPKRFLCGDRSPILKSIIVKDIKRLLGLLIEIPKPFVIEAKPLIHFLDSKKALNNPALIKALEHPNFRLIKLNEEQGKSSALHIAAKADDLKLIEILIEKGAEILKYDDNGRLPFSYSKDAKCLAFFTKKLTANTEMQRAVRTAFTTEAPCGMYVDAAAWETEKKAGRKALPAIDGTILEKVLALEPNSKDEERLSPILSIENPSSSSANSLLADDASAHSRSPILSIASLDTDFEPESGQAKRTKLELATTNVAPEYSNSFFAALDSPDTSSKPTPDPGAGIPSRCPSLTL